MSTSDQEKLIKVKVKAKTTTRVEIVRSFSYKLNTGNYQSVDFFCSQKAECDSEDAEAMSEKLYNFCKRQVLTAMNQYKEERLP